MFHKDDLRGHFVENDNDIDSNTGPHSDDDDIPNPVSSIVAAIHKQQSKKTAALPKNTIADPAGVILYEYIKLAGVKADALKKMVSLLLDKKQFQPKLLSDVSLVVSKNRIEGLAMVYNAYRQFMFKNIKNDINKEKNKKLLQEVFDKIAFLILSSIPQIKISSMAKEFHAMICNADINPFEANKVIKKRFDILGQKLQHQVDESYSFDSTFPCLIYNTMNPCKDTKCPAPHICGLCGSSDHHALDPRCPKYHNLKDWFIKRNVEINKYYQNKSKRNRYGNGSNGNNRSFGNIGSGNGNNRNYNYQYNRNGRDHYPPNQGPSNFNQNQNNNHRNRD